MPKRFWMLMLFVDREGDYLGEVTALLDDH